MTRTITAKPLTRAAFAPFGDVIDTETGDQYPINNGKTQRFHDLARAEATGEGARVIMSIARGEPYDLPLRLAMVERHPLGSQAFVPLGQRAFLVIVCPDTADGPGEPQAFLTRPGQGINYHRGTWHGVLTPIRERQDFLIVDRGGEGNNLEEFHFSEPYEIRLATEHR
jgi:ureidoglycolate lyase